MLPVSTVSSYQTLSFLRNARRSVAVSDAQSSSMPGCFPALTLVPPVFVIGANGVDSLLMAKPRPMRS